MNKIGGMKQIIWFMRTYVMLMAIFILQKPLFMLATHGASQMSWREAFSEMIPVMFHGLRIDLSMASYLMLLPGLLLLAYVWIRQEFIRPAFNAYMGIIAVATSFCFVLNAVLYPYWCFLLFLHITHRCFCKRHFLGDFVRHPCPCSHFGTELATSAHAQASTRQIWKTRL